MHFLFWNIQKYSRNTCTNFSFKFSRILFTLISFYSFITFTIFIYSLKQIYLYLFNYYSLIFLKYFLIFLSYISHFYTLISCKDIILERNFFTNYSGPNYQLLGVKILRFLSNSWFFIWSRGFSTTLFLHNKENVIIISLLFLYSQNISYAKIIYFNITST